MAPPDPVALFIVTVPVCPSMEATPPDPGQVVKIGAPTVLMRHWLGVTVVSCCGVLVPLPIRTAFKVSELAPMPPFATDNGAVSVSPANVGLEVVAMF